MTLAARLTSVMEERKLSQGKLAKTSGISQSMIWKLMNGQADGTTKIVQLAHALQVNVEWLQNGTGSKEPGNPQPANASAEPVTYDGLFVVRMYKGDDPTDMVMMVPNPVKSDYCRAYEMTKGSGCAEVPAGAIIVVDSNEKPGQNDLVYASVGGGDPSVFRYVEGGAKGYLSVDDVRVPLMEINGDVDFKGVLVYIVRDLRN